MCKTMAMTYKRVCHGHMCVCCKRFVSIFQHDWDAELHFSIFQWIQLSMYIVFTKNECNGSFLKKTIAYYCSKKKKKVNTHYY